MQNEVTKWRQGQGKRGGVGGTKVFSPFFLLFFSRERGEGRGRGRGDRSRTA